MKSLFKAFAYSIAVLFIAGYAFVALRGPHGVPGLIQKRHEIQELEKSNAQLAREIEQKRDHIDRLRESQAEQEMEIRQRLNLVKPNEKVFMLQDQDRK
jgi:cell division protein FtsB